MAVPKPEQSQDVSIIKIIQDMVREGESEEKVIQTLKELGVEPDKAKRLLLLGQADTFGLLRGEISKIVQDDLEKQKPSIQKYLQEQSEKAGKELKKTVTGEVLEDVKKYEKEITGQSTTFKDQMNENIHRVTELTDRVTRSSDTLGVRVTKVEEDLDEMKIKGIGMRNKYIAIGMLVLGLLFVLASLYLFFVSFKGILVIDTLIVTVIVALIGITLMFVSTLV
ncbi:MAG: hypothetical protein Q7S92_01120 [Candidatus Diapherotrites archaeon]|nr:hypothetical protein [Candidatus Diapherotrites archaeon]